MSNIFSRQLPIRKPKSSVFDLSFGYGTSFNFAKLIPVQVEEILPGDVFKERSEVFIRFAPLLAPIMERVDARIDYFFVPNRLVFPEFEEWITGGADGVSWEENGYHFPLLNLSSVTTAKNSLVDYFGIQPNTFDSASASPDINAIPFACYNKIWNDFFRDQSLQEEIPDQLTQDLLVPSYEGSLNYVIDSTDGLASQFAVVRERSLMKDYFTSAQLQAQRGDVVYLTQPFDASSLDIEYVNSKKDSSYPTTRIRQFNYPNTSGNITGTQSGTSTNLISNVQYGAEKIYNVDNSNQLKIVSKEGYSSPALSVDDFFTLKSLQLWKDHNNMFGGRYIEQLAGHYGVISPDARLQRPEYLGGGKFPIQVSEVLQTATDAEGTGVGDMYGHAVGYGYSNSFKYKFLEHGFLFALLSVTPRPKYMTGAPRWAFKRDRFDIAFPEFANIGEQPVYAGEIFLKMYEQGGQGSDPYDPFQEFGYQPRYSEYKAHHSIVTGDFRDSLKFWHLAKEFDDLPGLNAEFISANVEDYYRIFQITDPEVQHIYADVYHHITAIRSLPLFPATSLI